MSMFVEPKALSTALGLKWCNDPASIRTEWKPCLERCQVPADMAEASMYEYLELTSNASTGIWIFAGGANGEDSCSVEDILEFAA